MRCYLITAKELGATIAVRYAGTNADAKTTRDELIEAKGLRKKDVEIEMVDVPLSKPELLAYLNELVIKQDTLDVGDDGSSSS